MPPQKPPKKKPKDPHRYLAQLIREIHQRQQKIRRLITLIEKHMDRFEWEYREFLKVMDTIYRDAPVSLRGVGTWHVSRIPNSDERRVLQEEARRGVYSLEFKPLVNGVTMVRFNGVKWFELSTRLVPFLKVIAAGGPGSGPDGRGAWTSRAGIAGRLGAPGEPIKLDYVNSLLHRLRKELWANGVNDYYIETDRKLGIRLIQFHGNGDDRA